MDASTVLAVPTKRWFRCFLLHTLFSMAFWFLVASNLSTFFSFLFESSALSSRPHHTTEVAPVIPLWHKLARFLCFMASQFVFLLAVGAVTRPEDEEMASASDLFFGVLKLALRASIGASSSPDSERALEASSLVARLQTSRDRALFVFLCSISGSLAIFSLRWDSSYRLSSMEQVCRGASLGALYALLYLYSKRMILKFPVIQRPTFFCFKLGLKEIVKTALQFSVASVPFAEAAIFVLNSSTLASFATQKANISIFSREFEFMVSAFLITYLWEMCHHLIQILLTRRQRYAPPFGSSAAETSPCDMLLMALEESDRNSLTHYLAALDLCMLAEGNSDKWRLAALFEETGETYLRVISECLKPVDSLTTKLVKGLDGSSEPKKDFLKQKLMMRSSGQDRMLSSHNILNEYQLCSWCARIVSSITAFSKNNDRYGVAQRKGCNGAVVSSLLSCLLVLEVYLGRRSSVQTGQSVSVNSIKWTVPSRGVLGESIKRQGIPFGKKTELHKKAYAMADVIRTSLYHIVDTFRKEMVVSGSGQGNIAMAIAERDWLSKGQPLYGTNDLHVQHLRLFLDFRM